MHNCISLILNLNSWKQFSHTHNENVWHNFSWVKPSQQNKNFNFIRGVYILVS